MRKKQTQKEQNNMEVLILDSGYVPRSEKKQTEKGGMFLSFLVLFGAVGVLAVHLEMQGFLRSLFHPDIFKQLLLLLPGQSQSSPESIRWTRKQYRDFTGKRKTTKMQPGQVLTVRRFLIRDITIREICSKISTGSSKTSKKKANSPLPAAAAHNVASTSTIYMILLFIPYLSGRGCLTDFRISPMICL